VLKTKWQTFFDRLWSNNESEISKIQNIWIQNYFMQSTSFAEWFQHTNLKTPLLTAAAPKASSYLPLAAANEAARR
jgi:hypothetical protein